MEAFLLIPESEWQQVVSRLERLEEADQQRVKEKAVLPADEVLNVRQAAALLKVTPAGLRRARRAGRVKGVRINEKEWGFYTCELHRYLNRYNRQHRLG
jgi:mRNA-degrading endonuclease RelE of RelBE toxin-antitoxin system